MNGGPHRRQEAYARMRVTSITVTRSLLSALHDRRKHVRFTAFDVSTAAGACAERTRLATLSAIFSLVSRAFALILLLVATRVALPNLGVERFGVWIAISSIAMVLGFLDFGIANGLISQVSGANARGDREHLTRLVTDGVVMLTAIGTALGLGLAAFAWYAPIAPLFKGAAFASIAEARGTLVAFAILFGLSLPAQGVLRIYSGLQQAWIAQMTMAIVLLVAIGAVFVLGRLDAGMTGYFVATYGIQQLGGLVLLPALASKGLLRSYALTRDWRAVMRSPILTTGGLFFVLQIGTAVLIGANQITASALIGPAAVAMLVLGQRLFMISSQVPNVINATLWPFYADAAARSDRDFLRSTLLRSVAGTTVFAVVTAGAVLAFSPTLSLLLSGGSLEMPRGLAAWIAAWAVLEAFGTAIAMYLNGLHIVRPQITLVILQIVVGLPIKLFMTATYGLGGLLGATVLLYVTLSLVPLATVYRRTCFNAIARER